MSIIAIAGATGTVGSKLTRLLNGAGLRVRMLSRDPAKAAVLFNGLDVEVVGVDFDSASSLRRAFEGADSAFLCTGTSPRQVRDETALIDAAVHAAVPYLVNLSVAGVGTGVRNVVLECHAQIDAYLATQDLPSTTLRPTTYTDTLIRIASNFAPAGHWGGVAGGGRICPVDTRDVAACAAAVLCEGAERHGGKTYDLSGPSPVTMDDIATLLSSVREQPLAYIRRAANEQRDVYASAGIPSFYADVLLGLDDLTRDDLYATPTSGVFQLTGQPPRSIAAWIASGS